jgi:hypothetical protein
MHRLHTNRTVKTLKLEGKFVNIELENWNKPLTPMLE